METKKKFRCQLPHLQLPVAALPYEKLVNSLLPHVQTHPLFTFLIVSLNSDNQIQQNFGTMYRNGRQIVSIIDIFYILHRTLLILTQNVECGKIAWWVCICGKSELTSFSYGSVQLAIAGAAIAI